MAVRQDVNNTEKTFGSTSTHKTNKTQTYEKYKNRQQAYYYKSLRGIAVVYFNEDFFNLLPADVSNFTSCYSNGSNFG